MFKKWHNYILYLSLLFLVAALYRADYLKIPAIDSIPQLILAICLLCSGFVCNALAQRKLLQKHGLTVTVRQALAMTGLNIFGKYIPGKVWMVVGSAVYLQEESDYPLADLSLLFLRAQILTVWCGLLIGIYGLFYNDALHLVSWAGLLLIAAFSAVIFSTTANDSGLRLVNKWFKTKISLPILPIGQMVALIPWFMLPWILWGAGFFMLAAGLYPRPLHISAFFCFPLAGTLGVLVLLAPGGLGIREGVIVGYLLLLDVALPAAISISAASRLWFLIGEFFIFLIGLAAAHWPQRKATVDKI